MSRIVIVSNRTPGKGPAAGGLAVALRKVLGEREGFWFGWSGKLAEHPAQEARFEDIDGLKVAQIDLYYMQHFARFLGRLNEMKDVDGSSILQNSMVVYGCGNADGNRHTHDNLPVILAGGGGGTLQPGRHVDMGSVPMSNLFLSMADRMGVKNLQRIGDPYTDEEINNAASDVEGRTELDAVVAYLQGLGKAAPRGG